MINTLLVRNFTLGSIQFSTDYHETILDSSNIRVLKNGLIYQDYSLYHQEETFFYSLIPSEKFSIDDIVQIQLEPKFNPSNSIIILFHKTVISSSTIFDVNFPMTPGDCHFTINTINNIPFNISTDTVQISQILSPEMSTIDLYGEKNLIIFKNCPHTIDIQLYTIDNRTVPNGFYDFDLKIEKK